MALSGGGDDAAEVAGREASTWFARMQGPDAGRWRLEFERWRARDPLNRAAYAEAEQLWQLSAGLAATETGCAHLARAGRRPFFVWPAFVAPGRRAAFAGVAALLLAGAGALYFSHSYNTPQVAAVLPDGPAGSRIGEIRTVRLSDGSRITLDTDSAIVPAFTRQVRHVTLLRGRARFEVAHQSGRPFTVEAGGRTVVARGTIFDVVLGRDGVKVILLRGAVDVRDTRSRHPAARPLARLAPGQAFAEPATAGGALVTPAAAGADKWVGGMLRFDGAPLAEVLDETNRYTEHKIRVGDPSLARLRVSGAFHPTPPDALATILAATFNLHVERTAEGDFMLQPR